MEKRNSINTAFRLAFIFFIITFLLNTLLFCCEPLQRPLRLMYYGDVMKNKTLSSTEIIVSVFTLFFALLPKCILAFYNMSQKDMQKQRGIKTIILTAAFSLLSSVISALSGFVLGLLSTPEKMSILSSLALPRMITGLFSSAATIILYCCGAIEMYNGTDRNIYPTLNDTNNNPENTLS